LNDVYAGASFALYKALVCLNCVIGASALSQSRSPRLIIYKSVGFDGKKHHSARIKIGKNGFSFGFDKQSREKAPE